MNTKKILLLLIAFLLFMPLLQKSFNWFAEKKLFGAIEIQTKPVFSSKSYFEGTWQETYNKYINDNFGFRNLLVLINNQIDFNIFNKINANGVINGKENYLFETAYINAYTGRTNTKIDSLKQASIQLKKLQDYLSSKGKALALIIAPSKAHYFPEFLPDTAKIIRENTYTTFTKLLKTQNVNYIDLNGYFLKTKFKYPVFSKYGIHYTCFGTCVVMDSLCKWNKAHSAFNQPKINYSTIIKTRPFEKDIQILEKQYKDKFIVNAIDEYDIGNGINLLCELPKTPISERPLVYWENKIEKSKRPKILIIGDSFGWGLSNIGIWEISDKFNFWYYNNTVYPESFTQNTPVTKHNILPEIEKYDIIWIIYTEPNLKEFNNSFYSKIFNEIMTKSSL